MKRAEFEHAIRAAGSVIGANEVLVIGSQALHASVVGELPVEATRSVEVDVAAMHGDPDGAKADLIDGSIGEASMFHSTFGYYAQGVVEATAVLPPGWRERLVRFETPGTHGVVAWCLELHDLWLSKAVAGRPKDLEFCAALAADGMATVYLARDLRHDRPVALKVLRADIARPSAPSGSSAKSSWPRSSPTRTSCPCSTRARRAGRCSM